MRQPAGVPRAGPDPRAHAPAAPRRPVRIERPYSRTVRRCASPLPRYRRARRRRSRTRPPPPDDARGRSRAGRVALRARVRDVPRHGGRRRERRRDEDPRQSLRRRSTKINLRAYPREKIYLTVTGGYGFMPSYSDMLKSGRALGGRFVREGAAALAARKRRDAPHAAPHRAREGGAVKYALASSALRAPRSRRGSGSTTRHARCSDGSPRSGVALGAALGALILAMVFHVTNAKWPAAVRPQLMGIVRIASRCSS